MRVHRGEIRRRAHLHRRRPPRSSQGRFAFMSGVGGREGGEGTEGLVDVAIGACSCDSSANSSQKILEASCIFGRDSWQQQQQQHASGLAWSDDLFPYHKQYTYT